MLSQSFFGTLFNMAFSNIENSEKLEVIPIAIVQKQESPKEEFVKKAFEMLSDEEKEDQLFSTQYVTEEEAKQLLQEEKIVGYMLLEEKPKIVIQENGIDETIFKYVTEEIIQNVEIGQNFAILEPKIKNTSNPNLSYTMIEFYTLIAMACLYGGILGMVAINQNLANMSSNGKRVSVAPITKGKMVLSSILAAYVTQLIGLAILFVYTIFVLKVDYGSNLFMIILLAVIGSLAGLSMGLAIGTVLKTNETTKTGIVISVTMLGCFLSGMMGITMKYMVDKNIPILNKINPVSMITDGFYSLYYYDTLDRYYFNLASLVIFGMIMMVISYTSLRKQKFESL